MTRDHGRTPCRWHLLPSGQVSGTCFGCGSRACRRVAVIVGLGGRVADHPPLVLGKVAVVDVDDAGELCGEELADGLDLLEERAGEGGALVAEEHEDGQALVAVGAQGKPTTWRRAGELTWRLPVEVFVELLGGSEMGHAARALDVLEARATALARWSSRTSQVSLGQS